MNYTTKNLDNNPGSTTERILFRLKSKGPASTAVLAQELEMTAEAGRLQIQKLLAAGLIEGQTESSNGAGRPKQLWQLTSAGYSRFPDSHAQLAVQLIASVNTLFGTQGMEQLIQQRENAMRATYMEACNPLPDIEHKLTRLAELRENEGYMARVETDGEDWLLIEDHCPICAAATSCQAFCRSELQLFQTVLGSRVSVEREEYLLSMGRRCVYRIRLIEENKKGQIK
ncbi:metalloregulator ArsR/SmtB family transcription factor [Cellvibrio sp. PSBB023]|uniref:helix-turn-helix transcriptional regulator n=1 Tax=Cellvibrio sp. PSBB023 TaxID=1945512 RepID=UPI00098ED40F|nr:metalloregulator ArsR/SmtB family transcription factor [Cellvibrio sp. PSBB023]AQT60835.1 transcriptional regulator [Cellvibrio sp. PSBB023]